MNKLLKIIAVILLTMMVLPSTGRADFSEAAPPDLLRDFEILRTRVKQNPHDVPALNSLGIIYARSGKLEDAIRLWRYALAFDSSYVHLYNNLGSALKQLGKRDEARIVFKTGLTRAPSYLINYNLGILEKEERNLVAAALHFKQCIEANASFAPAIKQLAELGYSNPAAAIHRPAPPLSLGSYKPPVDSGNIDFYPTMPGYDTAASQPGLSPRTGYKKSSASQTPFTPMTYQQCLELIKSFDAPPADRYIALTFDDGPHHSYTPQILDILRNEGAKATFFVVGSRAETYPEIITSIAAGGHDVGNHTWQHISLTRSTNEKAIESLRKTNELISGLTGRQCTIVRPPFGHTNQKVKNILHNQGWHEILWDSDSRDWENKNPDHILHRVMKSARPGSIVLFHDIHPGAAKMLPTMIRAFKANGYRFITISDLIKMSSSS